MYRQTDTEADIGIDIQGAPEGRRLQREEKRKGTDRRGEAERRWLRDRNRLETEPE